LKISQGRGQRRGKGVEGGRIRVFDLKKKKEARRAAEGEKKQTGADPREDLLRTFDDFRKQEGEKGYQKDRRHRRRGYVVDEMEEGVTCAQEGGRKGKSMMARKRGKGQGRGVKTIRKSRLFTLYVVKRKRKRYPTKESGLNWGN